MRRSRALRVAAALVAFGGALGPPRAGIAGDETPDAAREAETRRLVAAVTSAREAVLRVQTRTPGSPPRDVVRNAVVAHAEGWLVMAGPAPGPKDTVVVTLPDGRHALANVWAVDAETALTVLHLSSSAPGLTALAFPAAATHDAKSAPPAPGTRVAMVTPTGAVALGAVRAHFRTLPLANPARGAPTEVTGLTEAALAAVATDLGSPWLDADGRVVGLLVSGGAEPPAEPVDAGIHLRAEPVEAYAVPGSVVAIVWPLLRAQGRVPRARLGVITDDVSVAVSTHLCARCGGQVVREVEPEGPARRAGVRTDDILVAVDGVPVPPGATLPDLLLPYRPADSVSLRLVRLGETVEVKVLLGERDR
jgi:S1-C subfamily serine protease